MKLPAPQMESVPASSYSERGGQAVPERAPAGPEIAANPTMTAASTSTIPLPPTSNAQTPVPVPMPPSQAAPVASTASLQASDDSDLIEKEWVNKAKQIVERTRDDPHKQTEELTLVKVDYMKKRYNKTIKLNK